MIKVNIYQRWVFYKWGLRVLQLLRQRHWGRKIHNIVTCWIFLQRRLRASIWWHLRYNFSRASFLHLQNLKRSRISCFSADALSIYRWFRNAFEKFQTHFFYRGCSLLGNGLSGGTCQLWENETTKKLYFSTLCTGEILLQSSPIRSVSAAIVTSSQSFVWKKRTRKDWLIFLTLELIWEHTLPFSIESIAETIPKGFEVWDVWCGLWHSWILSDYQWKKSTQRFLSGLSGSIHRTPLYFTIVTIFFKAQIAIARTMLSYQPVSFESNERQEQSVNNSTYRKSRTTRTVMIAALHESIKTCFFKLLEEAAVEGFQIDTNDNRKLHIHLLPSSNVAHIPEAEGLLGFKRGTKPFTFITCATKAGGSFAAVVRSLNETQWVQ